MQRYYDVVHDQFGNPAAGVQVTVYDAGSTTPSSLYLASDNVLTATNPISNPIVTDASGVVAFAVASGKYTITYSGSNITPRQITWVTLDDCSAYLTSASAAASYQPLDADLTALAAQTGTGVSVRTGSGTWDVRTLTGTSNQVTVTNGDGVAGNPTFSLPQNIHTAASPTFAGVTLSGLTSGRVTFATTGGALTDSANLTYSGSQFKIADATASTSTTTGALVVSGGLGVGGAGNFGAGLSATTGAFSSSTASTSPSTGALVVTGGLGVGGALNIGGSVGIGTNPSSPMHFYSVSTDGSGIRLENSTATTSASIRYGSIFQAGSNGYGISGWANSLVIEGGAGGGVTLNAYDTTSSASLKFQTGRVTRMSIGSSGYVSILDTTASTSATTGAMVISGGLGVGGAVNIAGAVTITGNANLTLPKTSGYGIKVDSAAPTFGWHDLLGEITVRGTGAADPTWATYVNGIRQYQFTVNDEVWTAFHIPHDYVPSSDLFLHAHWSHTSTTVAAGTVSWAFEITSAKGHNQAAFGTTVTATATQTASTTQRQHMIAEVQISSATPTGNQINNSTIEVDSLILVRCYLSANSMTGTVEPFLHCMDIHYQSTGIPTKAKAPNFYT